MLSIQSQSGGILPEQKEQAARRCWYWAGWEPDHFYRRIGARGTSFFGNGEWLNDWRENLESGLTLDRLEAAGASVLITRFYKGFSPSVERKSWPSLIDYVARAHERGLKVWGYLQGQSLFGESLYNDHPEAVDWVALTYEGKQQCWGGTYNRFAPCLGSEAFLEFIGSLAKEGLTEIDLDGIHLDNSYSQHCYCPRCKQQFRLWLGARNDLEEITGLESATYIEPPPLSPSADIIPDPISLLWIEFGVQKRYRFLKRLRAIVKSAKPDAEFSGNPAYIRSYAPRLTHSLDPALEGELFDSVCVENGNRPRYSNGTLHTQADKHLFAEAAKLQTWVTSWAAPKGPGGYQAPLEAQSIWAGLAEEFSFSNALLGNNWALRPAGDEGALLEQTLPSATAIFDEAIAYFRSLEREFGTEKRSPLAELVVYFDAESLSACPSSDAQVAQAIIQRLLIKAIPFKLILKGQPVPKETRIFLIPAQRALKQADFDRLSTSSAKEIWLLGECGYFNEWMVPRTLCNWQKIRSHPKVRSFIYPLHYWLDRSHPEKKYFNGKSPQFSPERFSVIDPILDDLSTRLSLSIQTPEGVLAHVEATRSDRKIIHLRDLREGETSVPEGAVEISFSAAPGKLHGFSKRWGTVLFDPVGKLRVPAFSHYACITTR